MKKPAIPAPTPQPTPPQSAQTSISAAGPRSLGSRFLNPNSFTTPAGIAAIASTQKRSLIGGGIGA